MAQAQPSTTPREAKLFRNNRSQAVRIPVEFELPGERVLIHRDGHRLIIEPAPKPALLDVLRTLSSLADEDAFPDDIDAGLLPLRDIDL